MNKEERDEILSRRMPDSEVANRIQEINTRLSEGKKSGVQLIAEERMRQINVEGWTTEHDATHQEGQMAMAAAVYAWPHTYMSTGAPRCAIITKRELWPWDEKWYKPNQRENKVADLIKAGALIAAEIDRLNNVV